MFWPSFTKLGEEVRHFEYITPIVFCSNEFKCLGHNYQQQKKTVKVTDTLNSSTVSYYIKRDRLGPGF